MGRNKQPQGRITTESILIEGHCPVCGCKTSGYATPEAIKRHGIAQAKNRLCKKHRLEQQRRVRGKTEKQLNQERDMEALGCRVMSKEEIASLEELYSTRKLTPKKNSLPYFRE